MSLPSPAPSPRRGPPAGVLRVNVSMGSKFGRGIQKRASKSTTHRPGLGPPLGDRGVRPWRWGSENAGGRSACPSRLTTRWAGTGSPEAFCLRGAVHGPAHHSAGAGSPEVAGDGSITRDPAAESAGPLREHPVRNPRCRDGRWHCRSCRSCPGPQVVDLFAFLEPPRLVIGADVQDFGEVGVHADEVAIDVLAVLEDGKSGLDPPFLGQGV